MRGQAFGLEKYLVRGLVREAVNLVFDRWTIARADTLDDTGEHRRAVESGTDDVVRFRRRMRDPARQLARMHVARAEIRKHRHGVIPGLYRETREVDGFPVQPRWRTGLQPPLR